MSFFWKIALLFIIGINLFADDKLLIFNQNSSNFPIVSFNAYNILNKSSSTLSKEDIEIYENGNIINDFNITKFSDSLNDKNLFIFALDLSGSLSQLTLQNYKAFIANFLSNVDFRKNRFAIIGFNNFTYNVLSPDTVPQNINAAFSNLRTFGNSNYDSLFYSQFNVFSYKKHFDEKYQIIVLNDGSGSLSNKNLETVISQNSANIYAVSFNSTNIESLKNTIENKSGLFFDNISNSEQIEYYSDLIYFHSKGLKPYFISFNSKTCSKSNEVDLINISNSVKNKFFIDIDENKFPYLEFIESNSIDFGVVQKSLSKTLKLKVRPKNQDIVIKQIIDDPIFKITGVSQNQILKLNNVYEINIKFSPIDTNYIFKKLQLLHSGCLESYILVSGGVPDTENLPQNLKLISPNGGEKINIFDDFMIKWDGILSSDTVSLEFSPDEGLSWDLITPKASGLKYNWINPPSLITNLGLIRIKNFSKKDEYQQIKSLKGINGNIVGLVWGKQANQLFTGSKDGFIRIWDTEKAEPLKTILNGINNLNFFDISYDEKFLSVIDDDKKVLRFYDLQSSFPLSEILLENEVNNLDWDNVSYNFVVATIDGSVLFFEYPNDKPFNQVKFQGKSITVLKFSPLGNKIAVGTNDGNIYIYNSAGNLINEFKNSDASITDISWNKSNTIISVSSLLEVVKVWDTESATNVLQINEKAKPVYKTSWSPNLKFISTINSERSINLWKPEDGSLFYSFNLHSNHVSDLVWNPNGLTIASAANNGEVLIWSIDDIPFERLLLQEDQSDAVFSLVKPSIQKNDIFLGQHSVGISFDSTISNFITNNGSLDIEIDSIVVWGDSRDNFKIISNFPSKLNVGNSLDLKVNFTPQKSSVFVDSIIIFSKNTNYRCLINAIGVDRRIRIEPNFINFSNQKIGSKSNSKQVLIENLTSESIEIEDYFIDGKNGLTIENFTTNTLSPFEKRFLNIVFEPNSIGEVSSLNYIKFSDINDIYNLVFNGKGIAPIIGIPNNIELPNILCNNDTSTISFFIKNMGNDTLLIDTIFIQQNNNDFNLKTLELNYSILPNDSSKVLIDFFKSNLGFSTGILIIKTNKNANTKSEFNISLIGRKEFIEIDLSDSEINLFANINESKNYITKAYNRSSIPIVIEPTFDNKNFKLKNTLPIVILPNDSADIEIELLPKSENGIFSSNLTIKDTCDNIYSLNVKAYIGLKNAKISIIDELIFDTLTCRNVSNSKSILIKNSGEVPLIIGEIVLTNQGQDNFSINRNITKKILQKDETDSILVFVDAVEIGSINSELRIYSNSENSTNGYNAVKLKSYIAYSSAKAENDTLYLNNLFENKIYHENIKIKNNGNTDFIWTFPVNYEYFVIDSIIPAITMPNQESILYLTFKGALSPNSYIQEYLFENSCDTDQKIVFVANVNKKAALGIRAGIINAAPGDTVELPIYLYLKESNSYPIVDNYVSDLEFNGTLLIPLDYESTLDNNFKRVVSVKLNPLPDSQGIIGKIRFVSYLGNSDSTTINISNSRAVGGGGFAIEETNGIFYLDSVCYEGGPRLIGSTGILRLYPNFPNPATNETTIQFSIIEKGTYSLELYDLLSNEISKMDLGSMLPGIYEITIDFSKYSTGNYFYLLKTPSKTLIRKMTINR